MLVTAIAGSSGSFVATAHESVERGRVRTICAIAAVWLAMAVPDANGEEVTASGALGVGMLGAQPASSIEAGIDVAGSGYAFGLAARARFLAVDGFRSEDWDDVSELAGVLRYGVFRWTGADSDDESEVTGVLGELGGVGLGHRSIVDGYAAGLDIDHGHTGGHVRAKRDRLSGELIIDDLVAPRIGGLRGGYRAGQWLLGAQLATDRSAPLAMVDTAWVTATAVDAEVQFGNEDGTFGALYADAAYLVGLGGGLHLGARGRALLGESLLVGARAEARLGTDRYLPGWFGPLYEIDRQYHAGQAAESQLDRARRGGLGGLGGASTVSIEVPGVATAEASYAARAGTGNLFSGRLSAPFRTVFQLGAWAAAETGDASSGAAAMAIEARLRLPRSLFVRADLSRLYRSAEMAGLRPVWLAQIAFGSVLGEPAIAE